MFDLRNRKTKGIKALRYDMTVDEFYPRPRDFRIDRRFWTVLQAGLYESAPQEVTGSCLRQRLTLFEPTQSVGITSGGTSSTTPD
ncbi:hypothetical protein U9M48_039633 [Paspalum notatum var. saurae]|uniref:Uncharacterized protein n=1 Tax=Paspalum notatum var. saurae TaxID=547442 RepID=A0AAQ3ULQ2_PASNO